ncbi:ACP S-malonyltransferase [Leucobacter denitrificans]|uniref:[acyl-carrier-protein] S-malonyltransferase n=1 Tax=Leucobacter denitrificans TaxID=683042 RepID=A0A7G9S5L0_9MICO|nr:ACP S-malonyltransferase [Leucobacter denitrificans]QNN63135.1 ACP S-malonyltransferase [Leucobacter denitrificans]
MIVIACPGQGSQTPGFLADWIEDDAARSFLGTASEASGVDLVMHGTVSDADTIRATETAQPLIVAASILTWRALASRVDLTDVGVAGHSVGEFAAAAAAEVFSEVDAVRLVGVRGRAMAEAAAVEKTGMSAVVGGVEEDVLAAIEAAGLTAANRNGGGQIVAAGAFDGLATLAESAPRGARVIPLQVAGAFHTTYMASAVPVLAEAAAATNVSDPSHSLWSNADGGLVTSGSAFRDSLVSQIAHPVRWDSCMESFTAAGITGLIELAPAGALTGIAKRGLKGIPSVAVKSPADLDAAVQLIADAA